jgi:hypothetical protein
VVYAVPEVAGWAMATPPRSLSSSSSRQERIGFMPLLASSLVLLQKASTPA